MAESPEQDLQLLTAGKLDMLIDYLRRHHKYRRKRVRVDLIIHQYISVPSRASLFT